MDNKHLFISINGFVFGTNEIAFGTNGVVWGTNGFEFGSNGIWLVLTAMSLVAMAFGWY